MKRVMMMVAVVLMGSAALAAQIVVVVRCREGQPDTGALQAKLKDGWRVVNAVPVQDSNAPREGRAVARTIHAGVRPGGAS